MDNIKTGNLIKELRKAKGMTQKDLADKLHITDRAVSKWERGLCAPDISLLEPLSEILEVKVTDLISGEQSTEEEKEVETKVLEAINYSEKELKKKTSIWKRRVVIVSAVAGVMLLLWIANLWSPVIFQRGNPIPYLKAAMDIDENNYYVKVDVDDTNAIYISLREGGKCEALFHDVAYSKGFEFLEQAGSGYIFSDGKNRLVISSEIYLGKFIVWKVPTHTFAE